MYKIYNIFIFGLCLQSCLSAEGNAKPKKVCVIGAGVSGLTAAKYLKEEGIQFTVLEATRYVGGTWRYDPRIGTDENGVPLYTSMYKNLRTNLPKPTMELRGFPLPENVPSFIPWNTFYEYLQAYARHYDLEKYIKFLHKVVSVRRSSDTWIIKYENVKTGKQYQENFDYVIVGSGHHSKPNRPKIPGEELFKGSIIHNHDYRVPEPYTGRRVLVIGGGPSAMDMGIDVAAVSRTLFHSHHLPINFGTPFPSHYVIKPDVKEFNDTGALFVDGTFETLDNIIYCTGFLYSYPFLDETSGLDLNQHSVLPLYKYMVNINQPTMIVMGAVDRICLIVAIDAQARYAAALIKGNFTLPAHEVMMQEWQQTVYAVRSKGLPMSHIHRIDEIEYEYYNSLSEESGIDRIRPVIVKIGEVNALAKFANFYTYRNYEYKVIDDNNFTRTLEKSPSKTT